MSEIICGADVKRICSEIAESILSFPSPTPFYVAYSTFCDVGNNARAKIYVIMYIESMNGGKCHMKNISDNELDHVQGGNEDAILASDAFRGLGLTYHEFDDVCDSFVASKEGRRACECCLYGACICIPEERMTGMACFLKK